MRCSIKSLLLDSIDFVTACFLENLTFLKISINDRYSLNPCVQPFRELLFSMYYGVILYPEKMDKTNSFISVFADVIRSSRNHSTLYET